MSHDLQSQRDELIEPGTRTCLCLGCLALIVASVGACCGSQSLTSLLVKKIKLWYQASRTVAFRVILDGF